MIDRSAANARRGAGHGPCDPDVMREVSHSERAGTQWERVYLKPMEGDIRAKGLDFDPIPFLPKDLIVVG